MKKNASKNLISALLAISFSLIITLPALAQTSGGTYDFKEQSGLNAAAGVAGYETGTDATSLEAVISRGINLLLSFVGVIFFALLIYGSFIWMTAGGNEEKTKKAKGMIMNSLVGLIITLSAYVLSYFLIKYFWQ